MNENKYYVYIWKIKGTEEVFYVGKGCRDRYKTIRGRNKFFLDMYNSHECYVEKVYENLDEEKAYQLEYELVQFYKNKGRLPNQTDGGDGTRGYKRSPEATQKSIETLKKYYTPEKRKEISNKRKDKNSIYQSEYFKLKSTNNGNWCSENNPNYHHYWSEEMKESLRKKQQNNPKYKNENNPNSKQIKCIETNEIFKCIKYACEKYNIPASTLSWALKDKNRTARNLHWEYINNP